MITINTLAHSLIQVLRLVHLTLQHTYCFQSHCAYDPHPYPHEQESQLRGANPEGFSVWVVYQDAQSLGEWNGECEYVLDVLP